jgi:small-conductance mechanosensitive channel
MRALSVLLLHEEPTLHDQCKSGGSRAVSYDLERKHPQIARIPTMSLRKSRAFRVFGYSLTGLALLTAAAHITQKAMSGGWHDTYHSAKLIRWTYGSALILICAAAVVGLVGLFFFLQKRWRNRRENEQFDPGGT